MITKIDCRLYIEGVQIPFNSVVINSSVNQPSICTIEVAPSEFVRRLLARSHILVVFLEDTTWRILWDGEMRGWGMSKSSGAVAMQITAMDHTNSFGFMTRNIVDKINANTETYAVFHTGAEFKFTAAGGATFADSINKIFANNSNKFTELFIELINTIYLTVPYFAYYNDKNKILERISSLPDEQIESLLRNTVATDYMTNIINNRFVGNISFDQIVNYFLDVIGYCRVPLVAPRYYNGTSPICLFKPHAYFSTPPVSNCLFPDMYHTISGLGIDYFTEPTRIILSAQETPPTAGGQQGFTPLWFFNEGGPKAPSGITSGSNGELMNSFLSDDEINKGVLPYQKSISYEQVLNIKRDDGDFDSMKRSMQGYAYYEFVKAKFAHRTCSVSCVFHPFAVVGFPGAIFESNQTMFGMVESISHVISADGSCGTTINFSHIYPADRTEGATERGMLYSPPIPKWVSEKYRPRGCDATYATLFGSNSSGHAAMGGPNVKDPAKPSVNMTNDEKYIYDNDQINIAEIASRVFSIPKALGSIPAKEEPPMYSGANANAKFAFDYTRRDIITLQEYMIAMNIGGQTEINLINIPTILSQTAEIYKHPVGFEYTETGYVPTGIPFAKRQEIAILLQGDLLNVTGKLGK